MPVRVRWIHIETSWKAGRGSAQTRMRKARPPSHGDSDTDVSSRPARSRAEPKEDTPAVTTADAMTRMQQKGGRAVGRAAEHKLKRFPLVRTRLD